MVELKPFRFWVQNVLPVVYDDSLSYYELLGKVVDYINKLIENNNELANGFNTLNENFIALKNWIENYFDSADFKEDISDALDEMVESGELDDIIRPILDQLVEDVTGRIDDLEDDVEELQESGNMFANISEMVQTGLGAGKTLLLGGDNTFGDREPTMFKVGLTDEGHGIELNSGLYANPNNKNIYVSKVTGDSNYEKLQTAITEAIENKSQTVIIDCYCDITGHALDVTKGLYYSSEEQIRYRQPLTIMCVGEGEIYKGDSGYMFTATEFSGDYVFINLKVTGSVQLGGNDDQAARIVGCSVFDVHRMIRIKTFGCSYTLVGAVCDGTEASNFTAENAQSNVHYGDTLTYSNTFYKVKACWDISLIGCLIENCNNAFYAEYDSTAINFVKIQNCCIESMAYPPVNITTNSEVAQLVITDNYFENAPTPNVTIKLAATVHGLVISRNRFAVINTNHHCVEWICKYFAVGEGNVVTGASGNNSTLYYITSVTNANRYLYSINDFNTYASITNNNVAVVRNAMATINPLDVTTISDVNSPYGDRQNFYAFFAANASVSNLPTSLANAFISLGDAASRIQFCVASNGTVYIRARISGIGYTAWKSIS